MAEHKRALEQKLVACRNEFFAARKEWDEEAKVHEAKQRDDREQTKVLLAAAEQRAQIAEQQALNAARALRRGGQQPSTTRVDDGTLVDKRVVARMLTTYLDRDNHEDVLELMARMLVSDWLLHCPLATSSLICSLTDDLFLAHMQTTRTSTRSRSAALVWAGAVRVAFCRGSVARRVRKPTQLIRASKSSCWSL